MSSAHDPKPLNERPLFSLREGWAWAREIMALILDVFPSRTELLARWRLPKDIARRILAWLAPLEDFVRRLVFAEAALIPAPAPGRMGGAHSASAGRGGFGDPDPAGWGVSFQWTPRARAKARRRRRAAPASRRDPGVAGAPLAERIEALRRVIENPARYAARLLRRLRLRLKRGKRLILAPLKRWRGDLLPRACHAGAWGLQFLARLALDTS